MAHSNRTRVFSRPRAVADFNGRFLLLALKTGESRRLVGALATEVVFLASQPAECFP